MCFPQGWFSPGQVFVMDEYCARYGVRGCHRHLCYLSDLLERAENGAMIDPTLLHYSFAFCASHVHGNRYESAAAPCSLQLRQHVYVNPLHFSCFLCMSIIFILHDVCMLTLPLSFVFCPLCYLLVNFPKTSFPLFNLNPHIHT